MSKAKTVTKRAAKLPKADREYEDIVIPQTEVAMRGFAEAHPFAPRKRPFRFSEDLTREIAAAVELGMNTMLTGPSGCGKTETVMQIAAHLGRPCLRFNFNGETRVTHLVGQQRPAMIDGALGLQFAAGDLLTAMREGWWVFFDEIDMASPNVLGVLHPVLEEGNRMLHVPETGETLRAHDDFHVFASGNTIGYRASHRARFAGTGSLNSALLGRFGVVIACDYPPEEEEIERVRVHVPDLDLRYVQGVCRVASKLREDQKFRTDFSTRSLIQWAKVIEKLGDNFRAFELTVLRKIESPSDTKTAKDMVTKIFGYDV